MQGRLTLLNINSTQVVSNELFMHDHGYLRLYLKLYPRVPRYTKRPPYSIARDGGGKINLVVRPKVGPLDATHGGARLGLRLGLPQGQQKTLLCIFSYITCIYDNILKI